MTAYRRVYDSRHLQADCQEPGSAPEPYARQSSMGYLYFLTVRIRYVAADARDGDFWGGWVEEGKCSTFLRIRQPIDRKCWWRPRDLSRRRACMRGGVRAECRQMVANTTSRSPLTAVFTRTTDQRPTTHPCVCGCVCGCRDHFQQLRPRDDLELGPSRPSVD